LAVIFNTREYHEVNNVYLLPRGSHIVDWVISRRSQISDVVGVGLAVSSLRMGFWLLFQN
jgi:hypothetical protein